MPAYRALLTVFGLLVGIVFASRGGPLHAMESVPYWVYAAIFAVFAAGAIYYLIQIVARRRRLHRLDPDEILGRRRS
jgi:hypothetical protein